PHEEVLGRGCAPPVPRPGGHTRPGGIRHQRPGKRGEPASPPPAERPERTGARSGRVPTDRPRGRRERAGGHAAMLATGLDDGRRLLVPAGDVQARRALTGVYFSFDSGKTWVQPTYQGLTAVGCDPTVEPCTPVVGPIHTAPNFYENGLRSRSDPGVASVSGGSPINPGPCDRRRRIVTVSTGPNGLIASRSSGRCATAGSSRWSPSSRSCMIAVPVNVFVIDAIR